MASHVAATAARGDTVQIDGICASSCTMQLAVGCVTPHARLGFHRPTVIEGPATAEIWAHLIAAHYPPALAQWYLDGPAKARRVVWLTAAQAVALGAMQCGE